MTVYFVGAGPGDPELLTLKAARIIGQCPVCLFAGSLVPVEVVDCAPNGARVLDTAPMTLDETHAEILSAHAMGQDVARVHSGDPSLYGAIAEQIRRLRADGIEYEADPKHRKLIMEHFGFDDESSHLVFNGEKDWRKEEAWEEDELQFCVESRLWLSF